MEGLDSARNLKELHIAHQRMPEGEKLLFEPRSLQAIAVSYKICIDSSGGGGGGICFLMLIDTRVIHI